MAPGDTKRTLTSILPLVGATNTPRAGPRWRLATIAALVVVIVAVGGLAWLTGRNDAGPLEGGVAAYRQGDYESARDLWLLAAEAGTAAAEYNLGYLYQQGYGVRQDYTEAAKWYLRAAEQGDAQAQSTLGGMYRHGDGVPQNYAEAVNWHRRAAEQGVVSAQKLLGFMYAEGQGVPQDHVESVKWYRRAAAQELKDRR